MAHNTEIPIHSTPTRSNSRSRTVASWAGVAVALVATGALATTVMAGGPSSDGAHQPTIQTVDGPYVDCMRSEGGSPDSLEHWVGACTAVAEAVEQRYLACMHDAGGTADSLERWSAQCGLQAAAGDRP